MTPVSLLDSSRPSATMSSTTPPRRCLRWTPPTKTRRRIPKTHPTPMRADPECCVRWAFCC
ncbi:Uncharacterised protein [Mycobacteroides abscessus subsp. abscessus]|nr:Uncharacterised protein [Mycobacteroides abscessus subsp. abscessus]